MPSTRKEAQKEKKKKSPWKLDEIKKFKEFLVSNKSTLILACQKRRMDNGFFISCSNYVQSRTSKQVKNHFYKSRDAKEFCPELFETRKRAKEDKSELKSTNQTNCLTNSTRIDQFQASHEEILSQNSNFPPFQPFEEFCFPEYDGLGKVTPMEKAELGMMFNSCEEWLKDLSYYTKVVRLERQALYNNIEEKTKWLAP